MPKNWEAREKKLRRRKDAMRVNSRGLITVILPTLAKKGKEAEDGSARRTQQAKRPLR